VCTIDLTTCLPDHVLYAMLAGLSQSMRSAPSSQRAEPRLIATYRDAVFVERCDVAISYVSHIEGATATVDALQATGKQNRTRAD
jgi:hypothetical protein